MKFHVITYGCQMNVCDSEWLSRTMSARGWTEAGEEEADVVVLNTCSVREKPELKVYSQIGRFRERWERDPGFFVAVGGCVAQQVGTTLWERFPYVRLVFGPDGLGMVPQALDRLTGGRIGRTGRISLLEFLDEYPEREQAWNGALAPQAFVNIMQGCDNFCAYCIVPYVRGRQKSRKSADILAECADLLSRGVREITLLGQNVNSYGLDRHGDGTAFGELLKRVAGLDGLKRLRFTTSHPKDLAPEVIRAFGQVPALCAYLHLPIQSGSDRILKAMGRKYTREEYLDKVRMLREACPAISLSTDLIVGFPGEERHDFEQTLELMELVRFESSFSFKYCDRPGVRAADLPDKVEERIKAERLHELQELQNRLTAEALEASVGTEVDVLVEGRSKRSAEGMVSWQGRDSRNRIVHCGGPLGRDLTGQVIRVRIDEAKKHSLRGRAVSA
jgi:tRNA-2-methylthio-N6-dimethylallyladenosine synthase